jgi:hypothetical protein
LVCWALLSVFLPYARLARSAGAALAASVPVHTVVTAEAQRDDDVPLVPREDVTVYQGHERDEVTNWTPLRGEHAALQFFVLIDDAAQTNIGTQLEDLRQFIGAQPPTALIGVAYMRDGTVDIAQYLTNDHALAAKAVRLPMGYLSAISSPYLSLVDLIKHWPGTESRREVLMISDGIDRFGGTNPVNPYVDSAIEQAQRTGIIFYGIYISGVGQ